MKTVKVSVPLLDEGTYTLRATQAVPLTENLYRLLPTEHYNPEDESWEFLPGSIVRCDVITCPVTGEKLLRAYEGQNAQGVFVRSQEIPE